MWHLVMLLSLCALQDPVRQELPSPTGPHQALDRLALYQEPVMQAERDTDRLESWLGMLSDLFEEREPLETLFQSTPSLQVLADVWMGAAGAREFDRWTEAADRSVQDQLLELMVPALQHGPMDPAMFPLSARWAEDYRLAMGDPGASVWSGPGNLGYLLHGALSRHSAWNGEGRARTRAAFVQELLHRARVADDEAVCRAVLLALRSSLDESLFLVEGRQPFPVRAPAPDGYPGAKRPFGFTEDHLAFVEEWLQEVERGRVLDPEPAWSVDEMGAGLSCAVELRRRMRTELRRDASPAELLAADLAGPFPIAREAWARLLETLGPRLFRERAWPAVQEMLGGAWPVPGLDQALAEARGEEGPDARASRTTHIKELEQRRRQVQEQLAAELCRLYVQATPGAVEGWEGMLLLTEDHLAEISDGSSHHALVPAWVTLSGRDVGLATDLLRQHAEGAGTSLPTRAVEAILARLAVTGHSSSAGRQVIEQVARAGSPRERLAAMAAANVLPGRIAGDVFVQALEDLRLRPDPQSAAMLYQGACRLLAHPQGWAGRSRSLRQLLEVAVPQAPGGLVNDTEVLRCLGQLLEPQDRLALEAQGLLPPGFLTGQDGGH